MGLRDTIKSAITQLKARNVAEGRTDTGSYEKESAESEKAEIRAAKSREEAARTYAAEKEREQKTREKQEHDEAQQRKEARRLQFQMQREQNIKERKQQEEEKTQKFQREQEKWNVEQRMKAISEKAERDVAEHKPKPMKTFGEAFGEKVKGFIKPASDIRERNIKRMEGVKEDKPLTRAEVQRMITQKQRKGQPSAKSGGKMSGGQFHAPKYGGGFGGSQMGNVDPFAGIGSGSLNIFGGGKRGKKKGSGKNMMDDMFKFKF